MECTGWLRAWREILRAWREQQEIMFQNHNVFMTFHGMYELGAHCGVAEGVVGAAGDIVYAANSEAPEASDICMGWLRLVGSIKL